MLSVLGLKHTLQDARKGGTGGVSTRYKFNNMKPVKSILTSTRKIRSSVVPNHYVKGGFTLIELLAVIGIVAILAAILIPVIFSVRERAESSRCVTNLRSLHSGYMLWANDHNGQIPFHQREDEGGGLRNITYIAYGGEFSKYINEGARVPGAPENPSSGYTDPHICPADGERDPATGSYGYFGFSYGGNGRMIVNGQNVVSRWTQPAKTLFYIDARSFFFPANSAYADNFRGRHGGKANAVFLDGHVKALTLEEIPDPSPASGPNASPFWNAEL